MNVLVVNHCSTNKGDKAVLEFVLNELATNDIQHITVSANEPICCNPCSYNKIKANIRFVPWGWNVEKNRCVNLVSRGMHRLRREFYKLSYRGARRCLLQNTRPWFLSLMSNRTFYQALCDTDLVISTGGHHVTSLLAPQAISPQLFEMAMTLLEGKPLCLWSQSIGPMDLDIENHLFVKAILEKADSIYVRDHRSVSEVKQMGVSADNVHKTFESVLGFGGRLGPEVKPSDRPPVVGISVYSAQARTAVENEHYVSTLARLIDHTIAQGYLVKFFPMQLIGEVADDRPCISDVLERVLRRDRCSVSGDALTMVDHMDEVQNCRFFIGHKTHSVIIALVTGTPLLAIAYHPKTNDFMVTFDLMENCIDDNKLEAERLITMFAKIEANCDSISTQQYKKSRELGEIVRRDFRIMLTSAISKK